MKKVSPFLFALSLALVGCSSGTPDCADDETLDLIDQVIFDQVETYAGEAHQRYNTDEFRAIADTYSISNIRTQSYDDSIDSYECSARITYEFKGRESSVDFSYRVDTEQSSGEAMIEYQKTMLTPIAILALSR